jgi:hypothetical protein
MRRRHHAVCRVASPWCRWRGHPAAALDRVRGGALAPGVRFRTRMRLGAAAADTVLSRLRLVTLAQGCYGRALPPVLVRTVAEAGLAQFPCNALLLAAYLAAPAATVGTFQHRRHFVEALARCVTGGLAAHVELTVELTVGRLFVAAQDAAPHPVGPRADTRAGDVGWQRRVPPRPV